MQIFKTRKFSNFKEKNQVDENAIEFENRRREILIVYAKYYSPKH